MVDNPNAGYYQPSLGSLTGFDKVTLPEGEVDIVKTGWSLDELRRFLLNENGANFASEEWVLALNELIQEHIQDDNNPHKVTLEQITPDFVAGVLENLTSGTVPDVPPFVSFDAACPLPLGNVYPAIYGTTNIYRVLNHGAFVDPASESEIVGISSLSGEPGLPLFNAITNTGPANWFSRSDTPINTRLTRREGVDITYPFDFYSVAETAGVHSSGVSISAILTAGAMHTATFFVLPTSAEGSLIVFQDSDPQRTMTIDLSTGDYTCSSDQVVGNTVRYQTGVIKVAFGFTAPATSSNRISVIHLNPNSRVQSRPGQEGRVIFHIAHPLVTRGALNHPVLKVPSTAGSTTKLVFDTLKIGNPTRLQHAIITLTLDITPSLPSARAANKTILNLGSLQVIRDHENIYVTLGGIILFTSKILDGLNIITFSYSSDTMIFKDLAKPRQTVKGVYPPLALTAMEVGLFDGYLRSLAMYAAADTLKCVEFLTNG